MSQITMEAIEKLLDTKLEPINIKLAAIEETVSSHTAALANLACDVKKVLDEKTISANRFDRLEHWGQKVGEKVGIKLEL